jgi:ABC-2 type transport system ATP-binding protein
VVIDHGRVVVEGTPDELKKAVGVATLHLRLADKKDIVEAIHIIQTVLKVEALISEPALITSPLADPERVTDLLLALREADIRLAGVSVQEPTLDEVFMAVTGDTPQVEKGETTR